jgi:AraC-like DNA-binding protein
MSITPEPMQRVGPLAGIPGLLDELGVLPESVLVGVGLSHATLAPDAYIRFRDALGLLEACAAATARDDFGLLLGLRADHRALGLVGRVMEVQSTLGDALAEYQRIQVGLSQGAAAYCIRSGDDVALGFGLYDRQSPSSAQLYGLSMAVAVNAVRRLTGGKAAILEVQFCHRGPSRGAEYARLLDAPVLFDQAQSCVVFPRSAMTIPNPRADPVRLQAAQGALYAALGLDVAPTRIRLRHELRPLLARGDASCAGAAATLGLGPRTLNRRLDAEGTTFRAERDSVRHAMACELLTLTNLKIGEIALALDFATHAAFDDAFRRWSGRSPTEWRNAAAGVVGAGHREAEAKVGAGRVR